MSACGKAHISQRPQQVMTIAGRDNHLSTMLATAPPITSPIMAAPLDVNHELGSSPMSARSIGQRQFKKHKALPKPQRATSDGYEASPPSKLRPELALDTSSIASQNSSPRALKHQSRRRATGPELPPTPPTHSRASSSSHSAIPSSPTITDNMVHTPRIAPTIPPTTPPDQLSPPTPDVTPPQPASRPKALHPGMADRGMSRSTTVESRTDSFRTAREEPMSSEEDDGKSTIRPAVASGRTSQSTVRKVSNNSRDRIPHPQALDLALSRLGTSEEGSYTPRTQSELAQFDGEWSSVGKVVSDGDDDLYRSIAVQKTRAGASGRSNRTRRPDLVEDDYNIIPTNNATAAVRQMSLNEKSSPRSSVKSNVDRGTRSSSGPSNSSSSVATSQKQSSGISSRSVSSTVVEAFLIDTPPRFPQKQRTLRHVRKQDTLRRPRERPEPVIAQPERGRRTSRPPIVTNQRPERAARQDSYASNTTVSSVSSGKARREVWKSGGIPVIVVPDRQSSRSQSREPSLRSTSSRRSRRTQSLSSAPYETPPTQESAPVFECSQRSRAYSLSDSSEIRTMDFPPAVPARSSSLSAPTSRNTSRAGSMTADGARAREALRSQPPKVEVHAPPAVDKEPKSLGSPLQLASPKPDSDADGRQDSDRQEDSMSTKKFPARTTPFSIISMETNGTAPEVSEAQAVHMYSHQNSSLLMVNHSAKPSDASDTTRHDKQTRQSEERPTIIMTGPQDGDEEPTTPSQPYFALADVDSPLRHPRPPPEPPTEPPAITFTSATPSGATPAPDKALQMGNYFEAMAEVPARRRSIVERALNRGRRNSVSYPPNASKSSGLIKRALSLTRRRSSSASRGLSLNEDYPQEGITPPEEHKLHPFWKPQWSEDEFDDEDDDEDHYFRSYFRESSRKRNDDEEEEDEEEDGYLRYPLYDNRPGKPKRRFSEKMKRTFSVLPQDQDYPVDEGNGPERRTIRRTSSGNLRVMRRRNSASSLRRRFSQSDRPYTAPDEDGHRSFWRGSSVHKKNRSQSRRRFSLGDQIEEIQNIPRRLSDRRREKRTQELRQKISGPRDVRDGVEQMIRSGGHRYDDFQDNAIHGRF